MKTLVFALLGMPLLSWVASGATVYTFTLQTVRGPIGFTYVAPEPLTQTSTYVNAWMLAGCDTTGAPGWVCVDAYLRQTTIEGRPVVQITLDLVYPPGLGDGFATDQLNESFPGASLESAGSYPGFLSPSILSVSGPPDNFLTAASSSSLGIQEQKRRSPERAPVVGDRIEPCPFESSGGASNGPVNLPLTAFHNLT